MKNKLLISLFILVVFSLGCIDSPDTNENKNKKYELNIQVIGENTDWDYIIIPVLVTINGELFNPILDDLIDGYKVKSIVLEDTLYGKAMKILNQPVALAKCKNKRLKQSRGLSVLA